MAAVPSSQSLTLDRLMSIGALVVLGAQAAIDPRSARLASSCMAITALLLALLGARLGNAHSRIIATLAAALVLAQQAALPWQLSMTLALLAVLGIGRVLPAQRLAPSCWAKGMTPIVWILIVGGVTPFALSTWLFAAHPNLSDLTSSAFLQVSRIWLVCGSILFAIINPALEELIWRGVFQTYLRPLWGVPASICLQALSFGVQHLHGFPRGAMGVLLATVWALMLGFLRDRSQGLWAPFLAHVVADATIAILVLGFVI